MNIPPQNYPIGFVILAAAKGDLINLMCSFMGHQLHSTGTCLDAS
jgi:hypothetical protein